jgi:hypothetical protein
MSTQALGLGPGLHERPSKPVLMSQEETQKCPERHVTWHSINSLVRHSKWTNLDIDEVENCMANECWLRQFSSKNSKNWKCMLEKADVSIYQLTTSRGT